MNGIVEYWIGGNVEKACGRMRTDGWNRRGRRLAHTLNFMKYLFA